MKHGKTGKQIMTDVPKGLKKLQIDIPEDLHSDIKIWATWKNMTIKKYVLQAIMEKMAHDEQYRNMDKR